MNLAPFYVAVEKILSTYIQTFVTLLIPATELTSGTAEAAAVAAVPAALTALAALLPQVSAGLPFYVDLVFRTGRTYVVTVIGLLVAAPTFSLDPSLGKAALVGAIPAALAVVKAGLAKNIGQNGTAALLPARLDADPVAVLPVAA